MTETTIRRRPRRGRKTLIAAPATVALLVAGAFAATKAGDILSPVDLAKVQFEAPSKQGEIYPTRTLEPAADPVVFRTGTDDLPNDVPWKGERISVDEFLSTTNSRALVVLRDGELVREWYADGVDANSRLSSWSVAKSVISLLVGQAIDAGKFSEDDRLVDLVPDLAEDLDTSTEAGQGFADITVRHLLDMTSNVDVSESYNEWWPFTGTARMFISTDLEGFISEHRRTTEAPGQTGNYLSANTQLLGMILAEVEGKNVTELVSERLWQPIGAQYEATWSLDQEGGIEKSFCCLNAAALDFAKIGQLVLDDGKVGDRQVVPTAWIERLSTPAEDVSDWKYSAQWWHPTGGRSADITALGVYGQYVYVNPTTRTVIVKLSDHGTEQDEAETIDALRTLAGEDPFRP